MVFCYLALVVDVVDEDRVMDMKKWHAWVRSEHVILILQRKVYFIVHNVKVYFAFATTMNNATVANCLPLICYCFYEG